MKLPAILLLAALLAAPAPAGAEGQADAGQIPLRLERGVRLPLGMRFEAAPGVVVGTAPGPVSGDVRPVGLTARATLRALRNLVMVRSDVQSVRVDDEWKTDWSIRVHLGEDVELATRRVLREVVGNVRSVGRRVL